MEIVFLNFFFDNDQTTVYQTDIEREFNVRSSTATANIRVLIKKGLLQQTIDPNDRRRKQLSLTHSAVQLEAKLSDTKMKLEQLLVGNMSSEQQRHFSTLLELAIKNLQSAERK